MNKYDVNNRSVSKNGKCVEGKQTRVRRYAEAQRTRIARSSSSRCVFSLSSCWSRELRAERCSEIISCNTRPHPVPPEAPRSPGARRPRAQWRDPPQSSQLPAGGSWRADSVQVSAHDLRLRIRGQSRGAPLPGIPSQPAPKPAPPCPVGLRPGMESSD